MTRSRSRSSTPPARAATRGSAQPIVLVLPGILGSYLGDAQPEGFGRIWVDPLGIVAGQLAELQLAADGTTDANRRVHIAAEGVFQTVYGELIETLGKQGYDARDHRFDWRRDVRELGAQLANTIEALPAGRAVHLVAHSMGGLVSRRLFQAHPAAAARVTRLIMLGTPNFGSFAPVSVFSGEETLLKWVGLIDFGNSTRKLIGVFRSFPGLMQMLPNRARFAKIDFFSPALWPGNAFAPGALVRARRFQEQLAEDAASRNRYVLIAGYGRDTVTDAEVKGPGEFALRSTEKGDGTVPLHFCLLDGVTPTYFTRAKHGAMPAEPEVIDAVSAILGDRTVDLPSVLPLSGVRATARPYRAPAPPEVPDFLARARRRGGRSARPKLTKAQLREIAAKTVEAQATFLAAPDLQLRRSRKDTPQPPLPAAARRRSLLIKTASGSITGAPSGTLVLGVFPSIRPQSSLAAVDQTVNGYITRLFEQGAIHGGVGEMLFLPAPGAAIPAELIVLVGLGEARFFGADTLRKVGINLARALMQLHISEFATVPIGSGTAMSPTEALRPLLEGFLAGLDGCDPDGLFRAITLCEANPKRLVELRKAVRNSAAHWAPRGIEVETKELANLPAPPATARARQYSELSYWIESIPQGYRYFVMGAAANPTADGLEADLPSAVRALQAAMEAPTTDASKARQLDRFGRTLADAFPAGLRAPLQGIDAQTHTTINLESGSALIPWELLRTRRGPLALQTTLTRRLAIAADHRPASSYLSSRVESRPLRLAIVANPLDDLAGTAREADKLDKILRADPRFEIHTFIGSKECSEARVSELMRAGTIDILHYAGHGTYDPDHPERSGLLLNGERDGVLTAIEVRGLERPPLLVFANACRVGIVGLNSKTHKPSATARRTARARQPFGFAEALLHAGVRASVGTFWNIPDDAAVTFAAAFYRAVVDSQPLGHALLAARRTTSRAPGEGQWAWASYMMYGPAWLKLRP